MTANKPTVGATLHVGRDCTWTWLGDAPAGYYRIQMRFEGHDYESLVEPRVWNEVMREGGGA